MPARHIADLAGTRRSQFRIRPDAAAGPPTTGAHQLGDLHMDSLGRLWQCSASGTPGTWVMLDPVIAGQQGALPVSLTVLDSVAITSYRTVKWALELKKGTKYQIFEIVASHNDTTPTDQRPVSYKIGTGTIDISADVDIVSSNLRLTVTPASTGWTATWRRLYAMQA